ncbi:hypothetical protein M378DRAFT_97897 [Amanita muscaria Koide BX008]|uniref:EH domain-containing protein n=1 Tax=Amanita muscaria (strain Koide BX008) TaxID=946122 RepID=A0A0C2TRC0_AMAMK|nr:hypothetical protein M378DRAFT_97897 [Amanita muscaria Koide BX008]
MPSATLQAKIARFESRISPPTMLDLSSNRSSDGSESLLETPISPTTAMALPPAVQFTPLKAQKPPTPRQLSPSPSPPNLGRKTSLIDLKDWVVEDEFAETEHGPHRRRNGRHHAKLLNHPSNGAPQNALTAPLIKLDSPPKVKPKPKHLMSKRITADTDAPILPPRRPEHTLRSVASSSSLQSSSTSYMYPSRRNDSLTVDARHTYPPTLEASLRPKASSGHAPASSISSFHSVSLSSDTDSSTPSHIATFPIELEQERDFSVKSYGSDSVSLSESYEEVPSIIVASPATERLINLDWGRASAQRKFQHPTLPLRSSPSPKPTTGMQTPLPRSLPPKVPPSTSTPPIIRPSLSSSSTSTLSNTLNSNMSRRVPPPPSRSSDRSSVRSNATSESSFSVTYPTYQSNQNKPVTLPQTITTLQPSLVHKTRRPTPIPPKARKRYEDVFDANVIHLRKVEKQRKVKPALLSPPEARKIRQAAGWRGLSIDLTTAAVDHPMASKAKESRNHDDEESVDKAVGSNEVLEGCIVRCVWMRSSLDKSRLRDIWNECDTEKKGVLDKESFVRGMWRIDEELRRAHTEPLKFARSAGRKEAPPRPLPRIKPILT